MIVLTLLIRRLQVKDASMMNANLMKFWQEMEGIARNAQHISILKRYQAHK